MIKAFFSKKELQNGLEELKKVSKEPLCPTVFNEQYSNSWIRKPHTDLPFKGGIYAFWWKGDLNRFREIVMKNTIILQGKKVGDSYEQIEINYTKEWLDDAIVDDAICLYIGKSTNIPKRITGHIKPTTRGRLTDEKKSDIYNFDDITPKKTKTKSKKPNTESQLRIGLERLLIDKEDIRPFIMKYVYLSYYNLDGYDKSITRFFLENLAIGTFHPLLNVDIER